MIIYKKDNIIDAFKRNEFNFMLHGCNCFHTMGAGVAKQIAAAFPAVIAADFTTEYADRTKLGSFSVANLDFGQSIANLYCQYNYGRDKCYVDYNALYVCLWNAFSYAKKRSLSIGMPRIGAGLAGGDWENIISKFVEEISDAFELDVIVYVQ